MGQGWRRQEHFNAGHSQRENPPSNWELNREFRLRDLCGFEFRY